MSVAPPTGDMPRAEFERRGRELVEWIGAYLEEVEDLPVLARVRPGDLRRALPPEAPILGESMDAILEDFRTLVLPGVTHWNHPAFHGYFAVTGSGPGILGELLAAALNVNAMVWRTSPAGTELEEHVLRWLADLLGLGEGFGGVIQDTASTSSFVALAAARQRAFPEVRAEGLAGLPPGRVYASEEAHSSIEKAVVALGLGRRGYRAIPTDAGFRMRPDELREAIRADRRAGLRPVAVVGTIGTTSTTSVDPVPDLVEIARDEGLWLHLDAAYAGSAALLPELNGHFEGWAAADSVVFNPHKWLFTPVDCSVLFMRNPGEVRSAFSIVPEYLRTAEGGDATNLMDYGLALGRRFRALKLWFVLRYFGADGIRARIRAHLDLARTFADWVEGTQGWELVAPVPFSTVVFRLAPPELEGEVLDRMNLALMEAVNASGGALVSHTRLRGRIALRLSIGHLRTTPDHLERTRALLERTAEGLLAAS